MLKVLNMMTSWLGITLPIAGPLWGESNLILDPFMRNGTCRKCWTWWHGNTFPIVGPLWGEPLPLVTTGFPSQKASHRTVIFSLLLGWTSFWPNSWIADDLKCHDSLVSWYEQWRLHCFLMTTSWIEDLQCTSYGNAMCINMMMSLHSISFLDKNMVQVV